MNTSEELKFLKDLASATSVILDPVYRYVGLSSPSLFLVFLKVMIRIVIYRERLDPFGVWSVYVVGKLRMV